MTAVERILVAVAADGAAEQVIAKAASLARALGASLRLASCVYDPYGAGERFTASPDLDRARDALVEGRRAELERAAGPLRGSGLEVGVSARWAYPVFDGLTEEATEFAADLLVAGVSQQAASQRLALTHTDWQIIRNVPCPVLIARGAAGPGYRDILVPVDPMHAYDKPAALDDALITAAQALGRPSGARLHLLHCHLPAEYLPFRAPGAVSPAAFHRRESSIAAHQDALQQLARRHGIPERRASLEPADARQAIPEAAARLGVDLVVLGSVARSRLKRLLIGSTTEAVLDRLSCDVLTVKPPAAGV